MKFFLTLAVVLWTVKPCLPSAMLALELDSDEDLKCAETIIKEFHHRSITLVNFDDDIKLAKNLNNMMKYKIIQRRYLGTEMKIPNEAYIVLCKNTEDCIEGLQDLVKDRYWNPDTTFCFVMKITTTPRDTEKLLENLHNVNVFKCVILNNGNMYVYNFDLGNHCAFTPQAISKYECKWLFQPDNSTLDIIRRSLKDFTKYPYAACRLKIRINVVKPYIFLEANETNTPVGYEDEFVKLMINNFPNVTLEYDTTKNIIGSVSKNFTTTDSLRDIQNGVIDGITGGTILSHSRVRAFDFTTPHILDDIILTVPKAGKVEKWIVMFTLFKPIIWALIFVAFFLMQMLEFALKVGAIMNSQGSITRKFDMFGRLTGKTKERSPRYLITLWVLFTWYITLFYQSGLTSVFTKPEFYHQINSIEELLERDYTLFLNENINIYAHSTKDIDLNSFVEKSRKQTCKNDSECMSIVASGGKKYALNSRLISKFYAPKFYDENGEDKLYALHDPYQHILITTYFKKGNPNIKRIRFLERLVIASGLNRRSMLNIIHGSRLKYRKSHSVKTQPLTFRDVEGHYYLFLSGCTLAMITFLYEILMYRQRVF